MNIAVPFAVGLDGLPVYVPLVECSTLIGGLPGSGKSSTLRCVIAGAAERDDVALVLIDPKRVELPMWRPRASLVAVEGDECTNALRAVLDLVDARYERMASNGTTRWEPTPEDPAVVVVVDELAELLDTGEAADKDRGRLLRRVLSKGRASGVVVIAATQRPSADLVATSLRDLFSLRIAHAMATSEGTTMVLAGAADTGPAHTLPVGGDGVGLAWVALEGDREARLVRSMWLPPDQARTMAEQTAHLRPALELRGPDVVMPATLPPPMAYGAPQADQGSAVLAAIAAGHVTAPAISRATRLAEWRVRAILNELANAGKATRVNGSTWAAA